MTYLLERTDTHTTKLNFKMKFSGNTTLRPCLFTRLILKICQSATAWVVSDPGSGSGELRLPEDGCCHNLDTVIVKLLVSLSRLLYTDTTRNEFNYSWKGDGVSDAGPRRLIILSRMRWQVLCWHQTQLHPLTNDILMMNTNFSR